LHWSKAGCQTCPVNTPRGGAAALPVRQLLASQRLACFAQAGTPARKQGKLMSTTGRQRQLARCWPVSVHDPGHGQCPVSVLRPTGRAAKVQGGERRRQSGAQAGTVGGARATVGGASFLAPHVLWHVQAVPLQSGSSRPAHVSHRAGVGPGGRVWDHHRAVRDCVWLIARRCEGEAAACRGLLPEGLLPGHSTALACNVVSS